MVKHCRGGVVELTVDSNGNGLSQNEVIRADEGRHSSKRVKLAVLGADIGGSGFDQFNIEVVLFR